MRLKPKTKVLIIAEILGDAPDRLSGDEKGYWVKVARGGTFYVNPDDIYGCMESWLNQEEEK